MKNDNGDEMELKELNVYKISMEIGEEIWSEVTCWNDFARKTIGQQLIRSTDSIAANIAEGYGRFHYRDNKNFIYYARGSLYETKAWLTKASARDLLTEDIFENLMEKLEKLGVKLNNYINSIGKIQPPATTDNQ